MNKLLFLLLPVFLFSCNSNSKEKCKYGEPVAIFSDTVEGIAAHDFNANGQVANETVDFRNGMKVEIEQSGCDKIRQKFQFTAKRPGEGDPNWFLYAADLFGFMGNLSPDLQPLLMWANAISSNADAFRLGESLEVDAGFYIKIDKINSGENVIIIVELSETPS